MRLAVLLAYFALGCEQRPAPPRRPAAPAASIAKFVFPAEPVTHADVLRQRRVPGLGSVLVCRAAVGEALCDLAGGALHRLWPRGPDGVSRIMVLGAWRGGPVFLAESAGGTTLVALAPGSAPKESTLPRAQYADDTYFIVDALPADRVASGRALFFRWTASEVAHRRDVELLLFDLARGTLEQISRTPASDDITARWLSPEAFVEVSRRPAYEHDILTRPLMVVGVHEQTLATCLFEEPGANW